MGKRVLMRLRHDVENPIKDGRRKGIVYAPVWPAGTVFQVEDGREEYHKRQVETKSVLRRHIPEAFLSDCFPSCPDLPPFGNIYIKRGTFFEQVGFYDLSLPVRPCATFNAVFAALEPHVENLGTFMATANLDQLDELVMHLIDMGRLTMDDLREARQRYDEQDENALYEQRKRHGM